MNVPVPVNVPGVVGALAVRSGRGTGTGTGTGTFTGWIQARKATRVAAAVALALFIPLDSAAAPPPGPILHEQIPPDPAEDLALSVALDGDLPAALRTSSGIVGAPDPRKPPDPTESTYASGSERATFAPDRETSRPNVSGYDDPFTPSTAPFKRLEAFDAVRPDYTLYVRDDHLVQVTTGATQGADDESFYADLVVDVDGNRSVRIPSVGPGARIVRARLGVGEREVPMRVLRDGADNWFVQAFRPGAPTRARLVMQVVIARPALGGNLGDPSYNDLPYVPPLPANVARDAAIVRSAIGVGRSMRPREAIAKLVQYFRSFTESDDSPRGRGSVYLDLALSKKGVCRHRSFAFMVTAQSLGIPARMILNEAHAWVEVHDGSLWRRIDLGGAGRLALSPTQSNEAGTPYRPLPDPFGWPQGAETGDDMVADARKSASGAGGQGAGSAQGSGAGGAGARASGSAADAAQGTRAQPSASEPPAASAFSPASTPDDRPHSAIAIESADRVARRGRPFYVRGRVRTGGDSCPHLTVEVWLRPPGSEKAFLLGTLASDDDGVFEGGIVLRNEMPLGDYDVLAKTPGDARCGAGASE